MNQIHISGAMAPAPTLGVVTTIRAENAKAITPRSTAEDFAAVFGTTAEEPVEFPDNLPDGLDPDEQPFNEAPTGEGADPTPRTGTARQEGETDVSHNASDRLQFSADTSLSTIESFDVTPQSPAKTQDSALSQSNVAGIVEYARSIPAPPRTKAPAPQSTAVADDHPPTRSQEIFGFLAAQHLSDTGVDRAEILAGAQPKTAQGRDHAMALPVHPPSKGAGVPWRDPSSSPATEPDLIISPQEERLGQKIAADHAPPQANTEQLSGTVLAHHRTSAQMLPAPASLTTSGRADWMSPHIEKPLLAGLSTGDFSVQHDGLALKQHSARPSQEGEVGTAKVEISTWRSLPDTNSLQRPRKSLPFSHGSVFSVSPMGAGYLEPLEGEVVDNLETALRSTAEIGKPGLSSIQPQSHQAGPLAQHVARQLAQALQQTPNRPVEISLSPQELGRVRLAISSSDTGIMVHLIAERPETMDLMRRQISELEAAFQNIGYRDIRFSFSDGQQSGTGANNQGRGTGTGAKEETTGVPEIILSTVPATGLDIRL